MNSIKEFRRLSEEFEEMAKYQAENPEMFVDGSICAAAYKQIEEDLKEVIPKANKLITPKYPKSNDCRGLVSCRPQLALPNWGIY